MDQRRQRKYRASRFDYTHTVGSVGETAFPSPLNPYHTVYKSSLFLLGMGFDTELHSHTYTKLPEST